MSTGTFIIGATAPITKDVAAHGVVEGNTLLIVKAGSTPAKAVVCMYADAAKAADAANIVKGAALA